MSSPATPPSREDAGLLSFAQKLMTILDEGRTTATYKYAVLLGLMDLCLEKTSAQGSAPPMVTTRELADKLVDLYWSHAVPYPAGQAILKQNSKGQAEILSLIVRFRSRAPVVEALNARQARRMDPPGYEALVRAVEFKLAEMPLPRLQRVGSEVDEFLYRVSFQDPARAVTRPSQIARDDFDNRILFVADAAEKLVALSPLLRPLVQREWTSLVARFNRFPEAELEDFLFGCQRTRTRSLKAGLRDIQDNRCFYCDEKIRAPEVDHFVPWARFADDGLDNLVLVDRTCNAAKRAHLAATDHVERWLERFRDGSALGGQLAALAKDEAWERNAPRTLGAARGVYLHLPPLSRLWKLGSEFEVVDRPRMTAVLGRGVA